MSHPFSVAVVKDSARPMLGLHGLHTAFRGLPGVEVVALVDSNVEGLDDRLKQVQAKRHYTTLEAMLASESPDIVVLCSRHPGDHLEQIRLASQKGCHLYCEKPISVFLEEADEIASMIETAGVKLAVAHPTRHDLAFRTMKQMLDERAIGTPLRAFGRGKCDHRSGGEDLIVLGTHILDLQVQFLGNPLSVSADIRYQGNLAKPTDRVDLVEPVGPTLGDEVLATFNFSGGVRADFESRKRLKAPEQTEPVMGLSVEGTEGTLSLRFDDTARQPLLIKRMGARADFVEVPLHETRVIPEAEPLEYSLCGEMGVPPAPWFLEANRFAAWDLLRAIEEDRPPQSNLQQARTVVEMIQGIYAAHLARETIDFPLTRREHPLAK